MIIVIVMIIIVIVIIIIVIIITWFRFADSNISRRSPGDLRIPPLEIETLLDSKPSEIQNPSAENRPYRRVEAAPS